MIHGEYYTKALENFRLDVLTEACLTLCQDVEFFCHINLCVETSEICLAPSEWSCSIRTAEQFEFFKKFYVFNWLVYNVQLSNRLLNLFRF